MYRCWCGNENLEEYSKNYFKCSKCRTLVSKWDFSSNIYNVESEESDLYGENYWEKSMTEIAGVSSLSELVDLYIPERNVYWLKYILKYIKLGATLAEVGCGLGQLQYILRRIDYEQMAFELSPEIVDYMRDNLWINATCGEFQKQNNLYDAVLAFDLFEHLINPEQFLENCFNSLKSDGVLCFQTPCYDPNLDYDQMQVEKPRFVEQLKTNQHVYLYSKESITAILRRQGFRDIIFIPAIFGDDYDMFFFAFKGQILENTDEQIDMYLNSVKNGRLIKAMLKLNEEKNRYINLYETVDADGRDRLNQIRVLTDRVKSIELDNLSRGEQIEILTKNLQESERDRAARAEQIEVLTQNLREANAQILTLHEALQQLQNN